MLYWFESPLLIYFFTDYGMESKFISQDIWHRQKLTRFSLRMRNHLLTSIQMYVHVHKFGSVVLNHGYWELGYIMQDKTVLLNWLAYWKALFLLALSSDYHTSQKMINTLKPEEAVNWYLECRGRAGVHAPCTGSIKNILSKWEWALWSNLSFKSWRNSKSRP